MSTQIQFKAGQPQKFVATRSFTLGTSGLTVQQGTELGFDGTSVTCDGSNPFPMPQLRGAIKTGWVVPAAVYDPSDNSASIPRSAGMQFRNAQGGNPMDTQSRTVVTTVEAEEQEVGNVAAHAKATKSRNLNPRQGQRMGTTLAEEQDGVPVRTLSTPARHGVTNFETESPDEAIRRVNSVKVQPGQGRTREEVLSEMSEEEAQEYLSRIEAHSSAHSAGEDPNALRERKANEAILASRTVVGRVAPVKNQQKEGFNITNAVGGGVETFDAAGSNGPVEETVTEMEGLRFTNTNVGRPKPPVAAPANGFADHRRKIAKSICPDFPDNYGFDDPVRKKIARLQADFDDRPDVIRAVAAADTNPEVRERLVEEFPEAFA